MSTILPRSDEHPKAPRRHHPYVESEAWRGYCQDCFLPPQNGVHSDWSEDHETALRLAFHEDEYDAAVGTLLVRVLDRHVERDDDGMCDSCGTDWPCPIAQAATVVARFAPADDSPFEAAD